MAAVLSLVFLVHTVVSRATYPPSSLAALIRDRTPGGLSTSAIEAGVRLAEKTGLEFLEHAALGALAIAAHLVFLAGGGMAALAIWAEKRPVGRARRGLFAAAVVLIFLCLLAASQPEGLGPFALGLYAACAATFASLTAKTSVFRIYEPNIKGTESPLDALRRSRRRFLRRSSAALGGVAAGAAFTKLYLQRDRPDSVRVVSADEPFTSPPQDPSFSRPPGATAEITPVEDFYNVDINITKPAVDLESWTLKLHGMVNIPFELDFRRLQSGFSVVEMAGTLSCISNEVGGDLVSTAVWRGVRLADLLQAAGVRPGAVDLIFRAADGYSDSIPLALGLQKDTLVAFGMNGQALPRRNGFPARMIIPGVYGMKNVKWLTSIEVSGKNHRGYWQKRGWSDVATVKTQSRIDVPTAGSTLRPGEAVGGVAWAGDRGISQVEVSQDGGKTWRPALLQRQLAPNAWRLWSADVAPSQQQSQRLVVRATDGTGKVQTSRRTKTHPEGASGLHSISVRLKA